MFVIRKKTHLAEMAEAVAEAQRTQRNETAHKFEHAWLDYRRRVAKSAWTHSPEGNNAHVIEFTSKSTRPAGPEKLHIRAKTNDRVLFSGSFSEFSEEIWVRVSTRDHSVLFEGSLKEFEEHLGIHVMGQNGIGFFDYPYVF